MEIRATYPTYRTQHDFLESVLRLSPRVAAFDCDGTLWSNDAGITFFEWEIQNGVVSAEVGRAMRARYAEYEAGRVSEDEICGEMVTMHKGLSCAAVTQAASDFMTRFFPGSIFPEMRELVRRLEESGCEVWAVSASNEWLIRAGVKPFGIAENRILASKAEIEDGIVTDRLVRVPSGAGKPQALREVVGKDVDAAFGNSRFDTEMLAAAGHPFVVNPKPELEATARERGWPIYFPDGTAGNGAV